MWPLQFYSCMQTSTLNRNKKLKDLTENSAIAKTFESICGLSNFQISATSNGHPLDNTFTLSSTSTKQELFKSEEGGWFHAACIQNKDSKPLLVFQHYCGGSGCLEARYGVIDPSSLKPLLMPSLGNIENDKQLSKLLGFSAPHLSQHKNTFCCE